MVMRISAMPKFIKSMTLDEARRIAGNIAKLPDLLGKSELRDLVPCPWLDLYAGYDLGEFERECGIELGKSR
jgi:hypothetical protein